MMRTSAMDEHGDQRRVCAQAFRVELDVELLR